jgi:hypothetical protein
MTPKAQALISILLVIPEDRQVSAPELRALVFILHRCGWEGAKQFSAEVYPESFNPDFNQSLRDMFAAGWIEVHPTTAGFAPVPSSWVYQVKSRALQFPPLPDEFKRAVELLADHLDDLPVLAQSLSDNDRNAFLARLGLIAVAEPEHRHQTIHFLSRATCRAIEKGGAVVEIADAVSQLASKMRNFNWRSLTVEEGVEVEKLLRGLEINVKGALLTIEQKRSTQH